MTKNKIIPIFVPHLGCPNDCVFCNQKKITGLREFNLENVKNNIDEYLRLFNNSQNIELAFYGGSFTAIEKTTQDALLQIALDLKNSNKIVKIRISTRPDCINKETIDNLQKHKVDTIELGVQSLNDEVLNLSKRGHNSESVYRAVELIKDSSFNLGLQQMVGLPGDTMKKSINTTYEIISLKPDFVRIYPTLVIKDTELEEMYNNKEYMPFSFEKSVEITTKIMMIYEFNNINIIRVGLQSSENLKFDKDVVAGPLNDAFREYCESEKLLKIIKFNELNIDSDELNIYANSRNISLLVGQKGLNKAKIKKYFNLNKIKFISDNTLGNKIKLKSSNQEYNIDIEETLKKIVKGW